MCCTFRYQFAKTESERVLQKRAGAAGVDVVSLCPSMIYGPPRCLAASADALSVKDLLSCLRGTGVFKSRLICDVRDVAQAHVAAMTVALPEPQEEEDVNGNGAEKDGGGGEGGRGRWRR